MVVLFAEWWFDFCQNDLQLYSAQQITDLRHLIKIRLIDWSLSVLKHTPIRPKICIGGFLHTHCSSLIFVLKECVFHDDEQT